VALSVGLDVARINRKSVRDNRERARVDAARVYSTCLNTGDRLWGKRCKVCPVYATLLPQSSEGSPKRSFLLTSLMAYAATVGGIALVQESVSCRFVGAQAHRVAVIGDRKG